MLPLPAAITSQLDKASIIRLTISYLKLRDFSGHGDPPWSRDPPPTSKALKDSDTNKIQTNCDLFLVSDETNIFFYKRPVGTGASNVIKVRILGQLIM
ncbi:Protein trachealess [Papilio xuthus]|uniref:Protein trachealess n=1 Tax=Papilio xuthus TaxID=66420 RepID=A0A194Q1B7_PAPXU|nr:Protein trachealess [Papilio xuthus]